MSKLDVLKKNAMERQEAVTTLITAGLGALPGIVKWDKTDKLKSLARILTGSSAGAAIGYMGAPLLTSSPPGMEDNSSNIKRPTYKKVVAKASLYSGLGAGIASLPILIDRLRLKPTDEDYENKKSKLRNRLMVASSLGSGIGGAFGVHKQFR